MKNSRRPQRPASAHSRRRAIVAASIAALLLVGTTAPAATETWTMATGDGTGKWNTAANWTGTNLPPISGDSLIFDATTGVATLNNNLTTAAFGIAGITFTATAPAYTIAGNAFTLTGDIMNSGVTLATINDAITLSGLRTITTTTGGGNIKLGGVLSGTASDGLIVAGTGTLTLTTANSYAGGTTVNGGILALGADSGATENVNSLGTGDVTVNSGAQLRFGGAGGAATNFNIANNIIANGATIFAVDGVQHLMGSFSAGSGTTTLQTKWAGKALYLDGVLSGSAALAIDSTSDGDGGASVYITNAANTFSGTITVNASSTGHSGGVLNIGNNAALASATVNTLKAASVKFVAGVNAPTFAALTGTGSIALQDSAAAAVALTIGGNNASTAYSGVLSGAGSLIKTGSGTLTLNAASTFTGGMIVSGGTVQVGNGNSQSSTTFGTGPVSFGSGTTLDLGFITGQTNLYSFANNFTLDGATVWSKEGFNRLASGASNTVNIGAGGATLGSSYADKPLDIGGALTGSGNLTIAYSGFDTSHSYTGSFVRLLSTGDATANSYTGTVTVNANNATTQPGGNYLQIGGQYALANATINLTGNNSGGSLAHGTSTVIFAAGLGSVSVGALSGSGSLLLRDQATTPAAVALTVGGGSTNPTTSYSGALSGTGSLTKAGSGTFTLSGSNSYTGSTTVGSGTVVVSGMLSGTVSASVTGGATLKVTGSVNSAATIDTAGTLTGSGTVGAVNVLSGGTIAPGNGGSGTFTTGAETWTNGGSYLWEISALAGNGGAQGAATGWDYLRSTTGALSLTADNATKFTLTIDSLGALAGWNNAVNQSWTIASFIGGITGFSADKFILDTSGFGDQNALGGGSFSLSQVGSTDLRLDFIAVPEPASVASLLGGFGILLALRRFRRLS